MEKIIPNIGWLLLDKMLHMIMGVLVGVWVARYLGPTQFGQLNFAIAFVALFHILPKMGFEGLTVRELVRFPNQKNEILGSVFAFKILGGTVAFILALIVIYFMRPGDRLSFFLVAITAFSLFFLPFDVMDYWFQSQTKSKYAVVSRNTSFFLISIIKIVLILIGAPLLAFAGVGTIQSLLNTVFLIMAFKMSGITLSALKVNWKRGFSLLKEGTPLLFQGIAITLYMRIDQVMLGQLAGDHEVGIFSVAVRLVEYWYIIPTSIAVSLFPAIIKSKNLGETKYLERIQSLYSLMIWMAIAMGLMMNIFSEMIISILYGERFIRSAPVLSLQAWIGCSVFFGIARSRWLINEGYLKEGLYVHITGLVLNIVTNLLMIPKYGALGASIASLIAAFGANFLACIFSYPIRLSMKMYFKSIVFPFKYLANRYCCATRV